MITLAHHPIVQEILDTWSRTLQPSALRSPALQTRDSAGLQPQNTMKPESPLPAGPTEEDLCNLIKLLEDKLDELAPIAETLQLLVPLLENRTIRTEHPDCTHETLTNHLNQKTHDLDPSPQPLDPTSIACRQLPIA